MLTQRQIAKQLGIPRATVAAALNPRLEATLRPELRHQIQAVAYQMGYVPNDAARRFVPGRADSRSRGLDRVGLLYLLANDSAMDVMLLTMMARAERELSKTRASLTFVRVGEPADWERVDRISRTGEIDGWLLYGPFDDAALERIHATGLPHVLLGDHRGTVPVNCVNIDNETVGRMAVHHLAALGHRRIAYAAGSRSFVYEQETRRGFVSAARELGLPHDDSLFYVASETVGSSQHALTDWLADADATALFAPEDGWAAHLCHDLPAHGFAVPDQLSLVGCEYMEPPARPVDYTRFHLPTGEIGQRGAVMLRELAADPSREPRSIRLAASLEHGKTTRPIIRHQA